MTKTKKFVAAVLVLAVLFSFCSCARRDGIIKEEPMANGTQKAYLYQRTADDGKEFCITILPADETFDIGAKANVYTTKYEPDISVGDETMLLVEQNEKDKEEKDVVTVNGIDVIFGSVTSIE